MIILKLSRRATFAQRLGLIAAFLIFLSIFCALFSNHFNSKVMGEAGKGVAVFAPEADTPEWQEKVWLRRVADWMFYLGIFFATSGLVFQVWAIVAEIPS
ncbi:hypothetical protein MYX84_00855 [Acidobacteria bacterium AH-259-O06]|nr:hypothetical protein [Acidobacteria bacterium AH-259-O06]